MSFRKTLTMAALAGVVGAGALAPAPAQAQENGQYMPQMVYRTGPYAPNGIPLANGEGDYLRLLNERDGGINGVPILIEECETAYNTDRGVECYEKMKNGGPTGAAQFSPYSTGITYALIERATADQIPIFSMGYGRADASYGKVFEYVFTAPATYWAGADAAIQYIKAEEGGDLSGKKIALVYHDSAYGKEPIATLEHLAGQEGYNLSLFPVPHPGLEQKSTWLKIGRQVRPDWVIMWGWGVMNQTAIKEAAAVGFPMERFIGNWWAGAEPDVRPAGESAIGYKALQFHGVAHDLKVHQDMKTHLYANGKGLADDESQVGEVLYNRGIVNAVISTEAVRTAMDHFGNKPMTGEQVQWGFENLNLTAERLEALGLTGLMSPLSLSCADHEGGGQARIVQWDGEDWRPASDWIVPNRAGFLSEAYEASAMQYANEKGLTPRDCN
ncbi:ABC transporter substrate-binding protein [Roseospirillum parvum]|uniref:Branched-chain amino acid transport system substrate-binding protein n=1 Tax=Roseospirillum parvum TaxID=83401 RepID=A0A1G8EGS1_9PROT|nr:ABC transporter substrate-binding protein [Roseospirillum parvum]SDH68899.1 branched-chain amino acid transport system substrate-binding protein [Roseospirillum parvum]